MDVDKHVNGGISLDAEVRGNKERWNGTKELASVKASRGLMC